MRSLVPAVPWGMETAWPRSCCSRAYASNSDCDWAVPALLRAASQVAAQRGRWLASMEAATGLGHAESRAAGGTAQAAHIRTHSAGMERAALQAERHRQLTSEPTALAWREPRCRRKGTGSSHQNAQHWHGETGPLQADRHKQLTSDTTALETNGA